MGWTGVSQRSLFASNAGFQTRAVPDGGITLVLLGLGLSGLAVGRRFMKA